MAEKPGKKTVSISIKRTRIEMPCVLVASGFWLREDKTNGLVEILFESITKKGGRVLFDPILMRGNMENFTRYATGLAVDPDDTAINDNILVGETGMFSNIAHFSQMGGRAETIFGNYSLSDWVEATRPPLSGRPEVVSRDVVSVMSSLGLQKKLLLDLILLIRNGGSE